MDKEFTLQTMLNTRMLTLVKNKANFVCLFALSYLQMRV